MNLKKKNIMKTTGKYFKKASWIIIFIAIPFLIFSQDKKEENLKWEYDVSGNTKISFENKIGELEVKTWDKQKVLLEGHIIVKGKEEEVEKILKAIKEMKVTQSSGELNMKTLFYSSWIQNDMIGLLKIRIKLLDGSRVTLKELSISYTLTIPEGNEFYLHQKYEDVTISDLKGNTSLDIYDCDFQIGKLMNKSKIALKYSKGNINSTQDLDLTIYDSKLELEETGNLDLVSKYSEATFQKTGTINMESYDDKINILNHGDINGKAKYTTLIINNMDKSNLELYDCTFKAGKVNSLFLQATYSKIDMVSVKDLTCPKLYDNQIKISVVGNLECETSKYSTITIESLANELNMISYDDNITIMNIDEGFSGIEMEWKYTTLVLGNLSNVSYKIDFNTKYTKLIFPNDKIREIRYHKDGSEFLFTGITKGSDEATSPVIKINGYDGKLEIK